jgi:glyoxylase-like metal-dependent hydrolase (beta-lactamase superfamily II)
MIPPLRLGALEIHRIVEQDAALFDAHSFFPGLTPELLAENRAWLAPRYLDAADQLRLCVQSYILRTPHHTIMVDTCVGNHKPRPGRPMWHLMDSDRYERGLAAAGFAVEDIDYVMCTHLHVDHVGWNTRRQDGRWVPTFPNARYVFADRELAYWTEREASAPQACPWITDSVLPIIAAGRADLVRSDFAFNDLVTLLPTPGHTIDHFAVHAGRPGADAILTGDMIHSPLQARYPWLGMMSDHDSAQAEQTRRSLFGRFCDTSTLFCTAHFPQPSIGRVVGWHDSFDLQPDT